MRTVTEELVTDVTGQEVWEEISNILGPHVNSTCPDVDSPEVQKWHLSTKQSLSNLETLLVKLTNLANSLKADGAFSLSQLRLAYGLLEVYYLLGIQSLIGDALSELNVEETLRASLRLEKKPIPASALIKENLPLPPIVDDWKIGKDWKVEEIGMELERRATLWEELLLTDALISMMLPRHLDRLLLCYMVNSEIAMTICEGRNTIQDKLQCGWRRLFTRPFRSLLVSSLRSFSGIPVPWLRKRAVKCMTDILLAEDGLQAVLLGYLEGAVESPHLTSLQVQVAKMIVSVPSDMTPVSYFPKLCPQIVSLLRNAVSSEDLLLTASVSLIIARLAFVQPDICENLILHPLCSALLSFNTSEVKFPVWLLPNLPEEFITPSDLVCSFGALYSDVAVLEALLATLPSAAPLIRSLHRSGISATLLSLYASAVGILPEAVIKAARALDRTGGRVSSGLGLISSVEALLVAMLGGNRQASTILLKSWLLLPPRTLPLGRFEWKTSTAVPATVCIKRIVNIDVIDSDDEDDVPSVYEGNRRQLSSLVFGDELPASTITGKNWLEVTETSSFFLPRQVITSQKPTNETEALIHELVSRSTALCYLLSIVDAPEKEESVVSNSDRISLSSELFTLALSQFLIPTEADLVEGAASREKTVGGITTFLFQKYLPAELLLSSAEKLLDILATVLTRFALGAGSEDSTPTKSSSSANSKPPRVSPLIQVIPDHQDVDQNSVNNNSSPDGAESDELLTITLRLFSSLLLYGAAQRPPSEEAKLQTFLPLLQQLGSLYASDDSVGPLCVDLSFSLLHRAAAVGGQSSIRSVPEESSLMAELSSGDLSHIDEEWFRDRLEDLQNKYLFRSQEPALRAYGLRLLLECLLTLSPTIWEGSLEEITRLALSALASTDTFVHLNAVLLLLRAVQKLRSASLLHTLVRLFSSDTYTSILSEQDIAAANLPPPLFTDSLPTLLLDEEVSSTMRFRSLLAEVLQQIMSRRVVPLETSANALLVRVIVATCLRIARHFVALDLPSSTVLDVFSGRQMGSFIEASSISCGAELTSEELTNAYNSQMESSDAHYLRSSALSLLAETLEAPNVVFGPFLLDVVAVLDGILRYEISGHDPLRRAYRRSAIFLLRFLITHRHEALFIQLPHDVGFTVLRDALRIVKLRRTDSDAVVRFQAETTLDSLRELTIAYLGLDGSQQLGINDGEIRYK